MSKKIQNLSIIGCGQVGTSILLALATQGKTRPTTVYDIAPETEELVRDKFAADNLDSSFITFKSTVADAVRDTDLIILATPMGASKVAAQEIARHAKPGAILTDTGSAKKVVIDQIEEGLVFSDLSYVPAHPGNGSQGAGPLSAGAGNILGRNSTMFLIDEAGANFIPALGSAKETVRDFWKDSGVITAFITTEEHDKFFGQCSHYQHALNFALMETGKDRPDIIHNWRFAGTALRNMTRVAISACEPGKPVPLAQMWEPIFEHNRLPIGQSHQRFLAHFDEFTTLVKEGRFDELKVKLQTAKKFRDSFDDPERRENAEGEKADLEAIPPFKPNVKGELACSFNKHSISALATNLQLPLALAYAQTMSARDIDPEFIAAKANPSFRDGTHPSTYDPDYVVDCLKQGTKDFAEVTQDFRTQINTLAAAIEAQDHEVIHNYIVSAPTMRKEIPEPRKNDKVREMYENKLR